MKALSASIVALVLAAAPIVASPAGSEKVLQNVGGGVVLYGASATPTTNLPRNGTIALNDNDYAQTGPNNSLAHITMPDSSVITMAQSTKVQMSSFSQTDIAHAKFVVVGKIRFDVRHPAGAQADYTFQTPTGQIAVRGTVGDIAQLLNPAGAPAGLQVNVYALGSANLPVQVTLINGQVFTLAAGQSLVVGAAATGALVGSVGAVSNSTFAPFAQMGAPVNGASMGITATTTATTTVATTATTAAATTATTTAVAAGAVGTAAAATVVTAAQNNPTAAPSATPTQAPTATPTQAPTATPTIAPTATPTPSSTSVPIVIQNHPGTIPTHPIIPHPGGGRPSPHP
jgi:hypothetical protein